MSRGLYYIVNIIIDWVFWGPCRMCIVKSMCMERCSILQKRLNFGDRLITGIIRLTLVIAFFIVFYELATKGN